MLTVYLLPGCPGSDRARQLAREASQQHPQARVTVIDLSVPGAWPPPEVFSVPTWLLNGRVFSLGNPDPARLLAALAHEGGRDVEHDR